MSFEYLVDPEKGPRWLFFVDAAGTRTTELLAAGDFAFVPAGTPHAYRVEEAARLTGTMTGGFERFFQHMGTLTDHNTTQQPPFVPDFPRMQAAAQQHGMQFMPDYPWPLPEDPRPGDEA
jgi:quercetin 2,3-dioxygenase